LNKQQRREYDRLRYQRLREQQLIALGHKCIITGCSETNSKYLQVHHIKPYNKRSRTRAKVYFSTNKNEVEIRCKFHHKDTISYCRKLSDKNYILMRECLGGG